MTPDRPHEIAEGDLFVGSFSRGLSVIRSFSDGHDRQTLSEIAKRAGVTRATARRLIYTLIELGYARFDGRVFYLTAKVLDLGYSYLSSTNLWTAAQPYMEDIVAKTGASCSISVLDGDDIVYVARVSPRQLMRRVISIGSRIPAHAVAMGRIQLAALDEATLRKRLADMKIQAFTSHTITDRDKLAAAIIRDGKRGWSIVDRELDDGISGIAIAIRSRDGNVIGAANLSLKPAQVADSTIVENLRTNLIELIGKIEQVAARHSRHSGHD